MRALRTIMNMARQRGVLKIYNIRSEKASMFKGERKQRAGVNFRADRKDCKVSM